MQFLNCTITALAQKISAWITRHSKAYSMSVYVHISFLVCSCERRETKKESDRQKERRIFPEDRSRGSWSLPVYYTGLSCLHSPHMCREFDRTQYWFHTASDVSISWSRMNSVFTSCRAGSFCTQRDLNVCCLMYEAEGKHAVKVLIRLWRAEVVLLFFQMKVIQPTVSPAELELLASLNVNKYRNKTMCNEGKKVVVVYVVQCFCLLKKILWSNIQEVFLLQWFIQNSFVVCHVFAWGLKDSRWILPDGKETDGLRKKSDQFHC